MNSPTPFKDSSKWLWLGLTAVVVMGLTGLFAYRPVKRAVMRQRALKLAASTRQALEARRLTDAVTNLRHALALAPMEPEIIRTAAQVLSLSGQAGALNYWQQLIATGQATVSDRQEFVRMAQSLSRMDLAQAELAELLRLDEGNRVTRLLVLDQLVLMGNWLGAVTGARLALKAQPDDLELQSVLAKALLGTRQPAFAGEAVTLLRRLAAAGPKTRLGALRTLITLRELPVAERLELAAQLEQEPAVTLGDFLGIADLRWNLQPDTRASVAATVRQQLPGDPSPEHRAAIATWLLQHGHHADADALLPSSLAVRNEPLFLARVDVLRSRQSWNEISSLLQLARTNLPPDAVACTEALLAFAAQRTNEVATHLGTALEAAAQNWPRLVFVANYAQALGQPGMMLEAWVRLMQDSRFAIPAANQLLASLPSQAYVREERLAYATLARLLPKEPEIQAQKAYLDLLFNEQVTQAEATFRQLVTQHPKSPQLLVGLAFAHYRQNRFAIALEVLEKVGKDWESAEPQQQLIYALVLEANQQFREARRIAQRIPAGNLRPPEMLLLRRLLNDP